MVAERDINTILLPSGFRDLLPAEAVKEEQAIAHFLGVCRSYGYERVRPPLAEFEDSLFAEGPGAFVKEQAFRFVDPVSQRMMALRCDITAQIARIVSTRLADEPRPLRLVYVNDVVRTKGTAQRLDRQFCQAGCEIISDASEQADLEIAVMALQSLDQMGVADITLDLSYTKLLHAILESYGINGADKNQWLDMLAAKDMAALENRAEDFSSALAGVISACGDLAKTITALRLLAVNEIATQCIDDLEFLAQGVQNAVDQLGLPNVQITIDPFEIRGFQYHSGACFTLYAAGARAEIGRGGRYDIQGGQSACGFTLYMDMVLGTLPAPDAQNILHVEDDLDWAGIKDLQEKGWIVQRAIDGYDANEKYTHVYRAGKITKR